MVSLTLCFFESERALSVLFFLLFSADFGESLINLRDLVPAVIVELGVKPLLKLDWKTSISQPSFWRKMGKLRFQILSGSPL